MGSQALHRRFQEFVQYAELRHLAYNVAALQREKMFHSLAVLSFFPSEGKTLLCAALAMAYAEVSRAKVLVVDTVTVQNKSSLILKDCFNGSAPNVEVRSLKQIRNRSTAPGTLIRQKPEVLESTVVYEKPRHLAISRDDDVSLIKEVAEDQSKEYGLVLFDTMPLHARNKSNVDPLLVARLAEASVLVMSREGLDAPKLSASLKIVKDPAFNLIGIISNEEKNT